MLIVFGVIFYLKNKRTSMIQQMTIGEVIDTPLELTLSQLVIGILAGTMGSIILAILGVSFGNNSGIEFVFITSILLLIIRPKLVCFAYSGALLGVVSMILNIILNSIGKQSYINVNILSLTSFIAVLHMIEGIIVMVDGNRGSIPVFSNRGDKIIGGFSFNRYWTIPVAVMIMISGDSSGTGIISAPAYNWWPIIKDSNLRPFCILGEIQKSLDGKRIDGLGKLSGGDFDLNFLTDEISCYETTYGIITYD